MRIRRYEGPLERLLYLRHSLGNVGMLRRLFHQMLGPIYRSETAYVALTRFDENDPSTVENDFQDEYGTQCVILTSSEELSAIADEILPPIQLDELREHFESGPNRSVILARQDKPNEQGKRVIGFRTMIRGQFTHFFGMLEGKLPSDALMITNSYVIPECRGHRAQQVMRAMCHDYANKNGIQQLVGAIMSHNIASLRAHMRRKKNSNVFLLGPITMVSILGGLYKKTTPFSEVLRMLDHPEEASCNPTGADPSRSSP